MSDRPALEPERYELNEPQPYRFELERRGFLQALAAMGGGLLYVTAMGSAGCLGAITDPAYDMDDVGYQMGRFVERAIDMLTPQLVTELKQAVAVS